MKIVVIGATGHVGSYLVPRLVASDHEVIAISRGQRAPYVLHPSWNAVERVVIDRDAKDANGTFGTLVASFEPQAVIDLVCFTPHSAQLLIDALGDTGAYLLHCGTIWVHGPGCEVPVTEDAPRRPFGTYGVGKAAIERLLISQSRSGGVPTTVLHPGHIVGPGWDVLNPAGHFRTEVFGQLARGEELILPNFGLETVHHVHADDVAKAFVAALERQDVACSESFHVVSDRALTLRGYAKAVAAWFGQEAHLSYLPFEAWRETVDEHDAAATWDHISHSPSISTGKARRVLGYEPSYTSLGAVHEAVSWYVSNGIIDTGGHELGPLPGLIE